jgi:hypothetical protein
VCGVVEEPADRDGRCDHCAYEAREILAGQSAFPSIPEPVVRETSEPRPFSKVVYRRLRPVPRTA